MRPYNYIGTTQAFKLLFQFNIQLTIIYEMLLAHFSRQKTKLPSFRFTSKLSVNRCRFNSIDDMI